MRGRISGFRVSSHQLTSRVYFGMLNFSVLNELRSDIKWSLRKWWLSNMPKLKFSSKIWNWASLCFFWDDEEVDGGFKEGSKVVVQRTG